MRRRLGTLALVLAALSCVGAAGAGIEDVVGLGPRAMALGGAVAARPGDFSAAYYNPAGLAPAGARREGAFFDGSVSLVWAHATLRATRPDGSNLATPPVPDAAGVLAGARFSLGRALGIDGLDGGVALYLPPHLLRWSIRPDDDPQWALLTDRAQVISAHLGVAYRLAPWVSVGVGMRLLFDVQTNTLGQVTSVRLDTDPVTGKSAVKTGTTLGTDAQVFGRVSPLAGVLLTPARGLRLAVVWRQETYADDWGSTRISGVPDLGDMGYSHHFAHYFEPTAMVFGASMDVGRATFSADLTMSRWSDALSTNRNSFGAGRFGDTLTPAFGVELRAARALAVLGGYRYQRSPLMNFGGPTNLLDTDRHVASLGLELSLGKLFARTRRGPDDAQGAGSGPEETRAGAFAAKLVMSLAYTVLVDRTETKDFRRFASDEALLSNPGNPSYTYGGHMIAGQAGVEASF